MRKLPLFFLLGLIVNPLNAFFFKNREKKQQQHTGKYQEPEWSSTPIISNGDDYTRSVLESINDARRRGEPDRLVLYTGQENIFKSITANGDHRLAYGTGRDFLNRLAEHPGKCIPNLTILSHGWGPKRQSGGKGIPIAENSEHGFPVTGMYTDEEARREEVMRSVEEYVNRPAEVIAQEAHKTAHSAETRQRFININGREPTNEELEQIKYKIISRSKDKNALFNHYNSISQPNSSTLEDLGRAIQKRDVKFCSSCLIQIYSCNLDNNFVAKFAQTTGCQIVYGTGMVTGGYKHDANGKPVKVNGKFVVDSSGASNHILYGSHSSKPVKDPVTGKTKEEYPNTRDGTFQRVTPIRGTNRVEQISIGNSYPLLK